MVAIPQRRVVHWKSTRIQVIRLDVPVDDVVRIDGLPVTSRLRTAVDIAHLLPIAQAQQLLDRMLVLDVVDLAALTNAIEGSRRHGSRQARRLMGSAADLAASEAERMAQALFRSAGHDWFEPNYPVLVGGRSRKIDLAFPAELLAIEIKGWAFHSLPEHVGSDGDRETDLQLAGWLVVSVSWFDLVSRPEHVVAKVRDALARRAVA